MRPQPSRVGAVRCASEPKSLTFTIRPSGRDAWTTRPTAHAWSWLLRKPQPYVYEFHRLRSRPGGAPPRLQKRRGVKHLTGKISRLLFDRGFGFLTAEDDVKIFFHATAVEGSFDALTEGQTVTYERGGDEGKGPRAI